MKRAFFVAVAAVGGAVVLGHCGGEKFTTVDTGDASADGSQGGDGGGGDSAAGDAGGGDSAVACNPACTPGRLCCNGQCINPDNDPQNCGHCGVACSGATPYCDGSCKPAPCAPGQNCGGGESCCGNQCCGQGEICCKGEGPQGAFPICFKPSATQPTCPAGCAPACVSDKDAKQDFSPVDDRQVLDALAKVPMSTWSYKTGDPSVRHLGPTAQDLHDAFGLGPTDRAYDPVDAHGVAFSSIRALYSIVKEQNARIEKLERENAELKSQRLCR